MIIIENLDRIAFSIFGIKIYWYGLSYFFGILIAIFLFEKINKKHNIFSFFDNPDNIEKSKRINNFLFFFILYIIIGGRAGYIIFYNFSYYIKSPIEIIKIYHGGMSFHGALMASFLYIYYFSKKYQINFLRISDLISFICLPGIFFGRIANFVNSELLGKFSDDNFIFGVVFPNEIYPRHPSQIYEAIFEGLLPFIILLILIKIYKLFEKDRSGLITIFFLLFYSISRFIIELFFRLPDSNLGYIFFNFFTMGQFFCILMFFTSIFIFYLRKK
jgi:phosphatidylglycerol:prolipoprotein diacylglycerol transferase